MMIDLSWWPLTVWHWFVVAALLLVGEILTPSTYLMWPASAAGVVGILLALVPGMPWQVQVMLFAVASIASNILWIRWQKNHPGNEGNPKLNNRTSTLIGQKVEVEKAFANGQGSVKVGDSIWRAKTADGTNPPEGANVEIVSAEGAVLVVRG